MNIYDAHCHVAGEGDAIVIVHPFILDGFAQNPVAVQLAEQFRVYSVTIPGFGGTHPGLPKRTDEFIEFFDKFFQNKFLDSFVLIGVSLGGLIAMQYAIRHPMHIRKLILVNPTGMQAIHPLLKIHGFNSLFSSQLSKQFQTKSKIQVFLQKLLYNKQFRSGPYVPIEAFQKKSNWPKQAADTIVALGKRDSDLKKNFHRIQKPVLLIGSRYDQVAPPFTLHDIEGRLQTVTLKWVDQAGHLGIIEKPDDYFVKIEQFI
ncbi:alpha/beta fold hydrolase [bacterium]